MPSDAAARWTSRLWQNAQSHDSNCQCQHPRNWQFDRLTHVPDHHCPRGPLDSHLEVLAKCNVIIEEFQQVVAFLLLISNDVASDYLYVSYKPRTIFSNRQRLPYIVDSRIAPFHLSRDAFGPVDGSMQLVPVSLCFRELCCFGLVHVLKSGVSPMIKIEN